MSDLDKLIAAVEAGRNATWFTIEQAISRPARSNEVEWAQAAADGDLNAALRLHEALLPGCVVHDLTQYPHFWHVVLNDNTPPHFFHGKADNPARAWLLAILRALQAKEARDA